MPTNHVLQELTWRGLVHQMTSPELGEILAKDRVCCYIGFDPSADSLHVGSLLQILLLVRMQRYGHRPIAVLGGATGMIGDPSGKSEERNLLDAEQVRHNLESIRAQLERFLDMTPGDAQARVVNNYDWLSPLTLIEFLRTTGKCFSVNAMMDKDSVRTRLTEREHGISYTEFTYMLLQAYDFLHLYDEHGCTLQLGGSDQWGNITAGVDLVRRMRGARVFGLTSPLLTTAEGKKLGKTEKGAVWLDARKTSPYQLYQYWIRTDDRDVVRLIKMLTMRTAEEVAQIEAEVAARPERREAQRLLARDLTTLVHGEAAAEDARKASEALFGEEIATLDERTLLEVMDEAPSTQLAFAEFDGEGKPLVDLMVQTGLSGSKSAARKDIAGGGVYVNNERMSDPTISIGVDRALHGKYVVMRKGKKSFHLVKLSR
jgi:tyrosyl-tRNA synthetase